jgi:hypothetical protein
MNNYPMTIILAYFADTSVTKKFYYRYSAAWPNVI